MNTKNITKVSGGFSHDEFFRKCMGIPKLAKETIKMSLPAELLRKIDFSTLKQIPETFVEENLHKSIVDILFSCHTKRENNKIFIYLLFEHQSTPDYWMSMRLKEYELRICKRFREENSRIKKLPLVYPIVFYNGKLPYNEPRNFYELFEDSEIAKDIQQAPFAVYDLTKIADEELKKETWGGIWLFFMKHIHKRHELIELIKQVSPSLAQIHDLKEKSDLLYLILCYYKVERLGKVDQQGLSQLLSNVTNEQTANDLMGTLAQSWLEEGEQKGIQKGRQEGIQKGRQEGIQKTASNLLKIGMGIEQIAQVTGLSIDEVKFLSKENK